MTTRALSIGRAGPLLLAGAAALGYYNQRAATRAERRERWEAKNASEQEAS